MDTPEYQSPGGPTAAHRATVAGLLLRAQAGDQKAFAEFYDQTSQQVFGLVQRIIGDAERSNEVTQEIYLAVWRNAHRYSPDIQNPMVWLMNITHRRAVEVLRFGGSRTTLAAVPGLAVLDEAALPMKVVVQANTDCLKFLSPQQRQAITLAYYRGLTCNEVAEWLSVSSPTVRSRIRDGLTLIRLSVKPA